MTCPGCGRELRADARFCDGCGTAVAAGAPSPAVPRRAPLDYTPKHLVDRILGSRSAVEGERKQVTVLFADVKGSMRLAEQVDPERWHAILDRFFEILSEGVHRFEGTVNQYTGDGIMALFGAPIAHEDHAQRACYAALHLRDALREYGREVKRTYALDFAARVGLNSGDVVVGKIGDDLRMDYTAQGHTVGLAQRIESLADGGSVFVSSATAALATGYFDLDDLGAFTVKGASEPVHAHELRGLGRARSRFDVSRARGLSRFVGRGDEMGVLEEALEQGLSGPSRVVGVVAEAGTGKSRLCYEFVEHCRARGLTIYEIRGLSHATRIPLLPILELMRAFFGIQERDPARVAREKVAGRLLLLDESLREDLPIFFDLLGIPDPERPLPALDPDVIQRRILAALASIVRADGQVDPAIMLVEDLHWLDPQSDLYLEHLLEASTTVPGLVIANFRPEYHADWMQRSYYQQIALRPFGTAEVRELLGDLLGDDPSAVALYGPIEERSGGNPFFIEEMVQALVESGDLEGPPGQRRLVRPFAGLALPETVQAVLAARIDRLAEREKHVLQAAAVIGVTFRERVLQRVVELPDAELREALQALQAGEFVLASSLYPELEYAFKHPLTQEVADRTQLGERRAQVHAATARAIEQIDADRLDERAALLAEHWEAAGEPVRAARWHERAAVRVRVTDYGAGFAHWQRVDALLRDVEVGGEDALRRDRSLVEQLAMAFRVGIPEEAASDLFERGRTAFTLRGDEVMLARLITGYGAIMYNKGRFADYMGLAREGVATARRSGDADVLAATMLDLVWALVQHGSLAEALEAADEGVALAGDDLELGMETSGYSILVTNLTFGAYALLLLGRLDAAEQRLDRAFRIAPERTPAETLTWMNSLRAELQLARGDLSGALRTGRRAMESAERSGSPFDAVIASLRLAQTAVAHGNWREGLDLSERAEEIDRGRGTGTGHRLLMSFAPALAWLGLGEIERARTAADEALARCSEEQVRLPACRLHMARAAIAHADGQSARVREHLDAAERLIEETGARLFLPELEAARARLA